MVPLTPEQLARGKIDAQFAACGWAVQDYADVDFGAGRASALREVPLKTGPCDYLLLGEELPAGLSTFGVCPMMLDSCKSWTQRATREGDLLEAALQAARAHGLDCDLVERGPGMQDDSGADARVRLRHGGRAATYHVEVKRTLQPAVPGAALARLRRLPAPALLVTDYVIPPMAGRLRGQGVQFIDAAGKAWLDVPPLLAWVKGQRPCAPTCTSR